MMQEKFYVVFFKNYDAFINLLCVIIKNKTYLICVLHKIFFIYDIT